MNRAFAAIAVPALLAVAPVSDAPQYLTATFQYIQPHDPLVFFGRPSDQAVDPGGTLLAVKTSHVNMPSKSVRSMYSEIRTLFGNRRETCKK